MAKAKRIDKIPSKYRKVVEKQLDSIALVIHARRKEMNLTQESLAELLDVSALTVQYIEQGRRFPSLPVLFYICRVMDIQIKIGPE